MLVAGRVGLVECATGDCPRAVAPHRACRRARARSALPPAEGVLVGLDRAHRRRGDRERRQRVPAAASKNAARDARRSRRRSRSRCSSASRTSPCTCMRGRARPTPSSRRSRGPSSRPARAGAFMYYGVQILTFARPDPRGEHVLPGLSATRRRCSPATGSPPRQFTNLGDRLVFSNGVLVLAGAAALLIWIYHANTTTSIHLYVVGVFTAFTLSQAGMVRYWRRTHGDGWRLARADQRRRRGRPRSS